MFASESKFVGNHPKIIKAIEFSKNVAVTKAPVLIVGESGSGKRTICQYIHEMSARKNAEVLAVDCSQEAKAVENEILGYRDEEGKFNKGVLERANAGSIILNNIDALDETFQKRLYQILQELADYDLDVRILATTTKNLSKYVGSGRFYRALYTYFSGSQISLIPLRERGADIEALAEFFAAEYTTANQREAVNFTEEAKKKIGSFYWAHNVAELKSVIESTIENSTDVSIDVNAIEIGEKKAETVTNEADEDGMRIISLK